MEKNMRFILILLLMLISVTVGLYSNQPRFRSDNGHLYIESSTNHNITLNTKGQGYINVNNENLLQIIGLAKEAWDIVESFRTNDLPAFTDTMKNVVPMIDGPRSLTSRVTALELQVLNGTSTLLQPTNKKGGDIPNARKLLIRLTNLEKKVNNLVNLLSISECLSNPCQNGGTCMDLYNGFQCNCPPNWQGRTCEIDVDECVRFMHTDLGCQNGAECKNIPGSYECLCAPNWYGLHCTKKKNDCNAASSAELCGNGVCINQPSILGFTCICNQGWTTENGNSPACTKDVDECKENRHTCSVNPPVECRNTRGSFTCGNCPKGYEGDGFVCTDINECLNNNGGCSLNPRVQCLNTLGSFKCKSCPPGYSGDGFNCVYMTGGACAINNGGCHPNAECTVYAETSILCTCRQGYKGNGIGINGCSLDNSIINPCTNVSCGRHGMCIQNMNHTFTCLCDDGYIGKTCNISLRDPCLDNPCHNGECIRGPEPNLFTCNCPLGYFGPFCESLSETCGGYYDTNNGSIRYPESNSTLKYQSNLNCAWTIDVNQSYVIDISFVWIDVEKTMNCAFDYVAILNSDDDDGKVLGKFCGSAIPMNNSIVSDSNTVVVRFHTDQSKNYGGFQLNYKIAKPNCGGSLYVESHGTLSSPGSPGKYPPNRDCYWTLNAIPGKRIQFHFFTLRFERHLNCSFDYLEIRDGFTKHSPILAKLCNSTIPPPVLTSGSNANLHFHSDGTGQDYGFQLSYSVIEGIPGCGGIYTSPSGIISSPVDLTTDNSNYMDNLNCEWHITMPLYQKVKLIFVKKFGIEFSSNCSTDFLEIHDGPNVKSPLIGRYCGNRRFDQPIITNSNEVTLYFKSDFSSNAEGFTIKYEIVCGGTFTDSKGIIESPFYPNPYPQNKICTYLIAQPVGKAIRLSFLDMDIEGLSYPKCIYDYLEIRDGDNEDSTRIALLCGSIENLPKLPYLSTHNYMWLKFSTDHSGINKGFQANYSTIDIKCGGILKDPSGIIQSSKYPEQYLHNQLCKWIISVNESQQIQLTWLTFSLESQLNCNNDFVEIYDNSIPANASKIARYCGTKVPPILTSLGNRLTVIFKTDHSVAQDGFMLSYISLNKAQACGGNFFTSEGFIKSPNFPDDYPKLKDCTWTITVSVTNQIELNVTEFLLEESADCRFDFLEIRNGGYSTSPLIGKFCGSKIRPIITSMGNSLFIRFVSDSSRNRKGFLLQWYITTKGCGGLLNSAIGHIVSPNYPLPVQETLECFYKIVVPQGSQIKLTISDIELTTNNFLGSCKEDYLEFYDGGNTASKSLGTYCLDIHSSTLVHSSSNQMYIKYRNSGFSRGRGFSLSYDTNCNVTIKGYQGAIEIDNKEYLKTDKCAWIIVAPKGSKINITFTSLQINKYKNRFSTFLSTYMNNTKNQGPENQCNNSHLTISEGVNVNEINSVLWKYCVSDPPSIISSSKNIVKINYSITVRNTVFIMEKFGGFRIEWIINGCGGLLDQSEGEFMSPGYPGYYPASITCEWNIIVDHGQIIEITIQDLWLDTTINCTYDFLAIYSGHDDSGPELLRLCHKQISPITITSGGNEAFVRFESDEEGRRKGFKATYRKIKSKCGGKFIAPQGIIHTSNYPQNYDSNSSCMWFIEIAETHLINLTFIDFSTRNFPLTNKDIVLVYDGDINGKLLLNHSGNAIPPPIISSSNKLLVSFEVGKRELRAKGFKAIYSTACGAKLITNDSGIITSDSYLTKTSHENCTWTIIGDTPQAKITLSFTHLDLIHFNEYTIENKENQTNSLEVYTTNTIIRILDGPDSDAPEIMKLYKSVKIPLHIVSNGPALRIEFIDHSFGLNSFTATYSVRSMSCGGIYDVTKGTISTPTYPNNYLRDSECVWTLKASVGNHISLTFIDFELEENEFCNEDYVEIRDKDSVGPILGIFCGTNLPTNNTISSSLWVKFRSNSLGSAKGFTANFNYVTENYLTQQTGEISNPMYPKSYRNSDDYSWTITVKQGKRIQIVIKEIICVSLIHHLKIYDGSNIEASNLLELNYNNYDNFLNETITSNDNIVYIKLKAGSTDISGIHFLLSWIQIDEIYYNILYPEYEVLRNKSSFDYYLSPSTNTSIILTSPGYPYGYAPNLNVSWIIHTDSFYHIEIDFLVVDLNSINSPKESYFMDYINVETVDPDTADIIFLKMISKNTDKKNNLKVIGKNKVILTFISNKSLNGSGFSAEAKLKCGGQLRGPNGVIIMDGSTMATSYIRDICTWNVTVRPGKTILVKFLSMEIYTSGDTCSDSYVIFRNGFYEDSPILGEGKYCNMTNSPTLVTSENKLQVQAKLTPQEIIKISFEEKSTNCGGKMYLSDVNNITQIASPSYPNIPPAHIECIWTVGAPSGERLIVNIVDLDLSSDESCEKEYLEFRDGAAVFSPLINHLCKYYEMPDIETKENFLYIKYFTDSNVPGNGFKLNITIAKCGGTRHASKGTITSPNYPGSYESNMDCEYRIVVDPNYNIVLNFVTVNLKRRFGNPGVGSSEDKMNNDTYDDTLTVYDIDSFNNTRIMLTQIFGSDIPSKPIKSSGRELVIKFKSHVKSGPFFMKNLQAKFVITYWTEYNDCDKLFELESGEITSPVVLESQRTFCMYRIKVPNGRRVILEVVEGRSVVQSCDSYRLLENIFKEKLVCFMGGNFYQSMCIEPFIDPSSLNYIYESSSNEMNFAYEFVRGIQSGFRVKFSSGKPSVCGGIIDASNKGKIEMPFGNVTTFICQWDFKNTNGSVVIIANFKINESKISCIDNNQLLFASDELGSTILKSYCPVSNKNDKFTIISPYPLTKLLVKANSKTVNMVATLDYYVNSCGGIISGRKITISSPNYPNNYEQTTNCAWLAKLSEDDNVNIHFNDIDLDSSCNKNYIILHDGPSPDSPVLGKYCGNVLPEDIVATSNEIWIVFSTENVSSKKRGFNLTLESAQIGCGKIYVSETGEFMSKNYPNLYPNNEECEWIIAVWPGNRINLQFIERFGLEQSVNCTKDYVQIYDYINETWVQLGNRLCGRQIPTAVTSTEKKLKIRLRTDKNIQGDGFKATWKSFCGGIFTQSSGIIISPNYPRNYPNSIQCNYTILAPKKKIQLIFKSFNLEDSRCKFDNFTIYNKVDALVDQTTHFTGSYCGDKVPHKLMFMDSVMMIFTTDSTSTEKGFEIHYTTEGCGGLITTPGLIKSPVNYEDSYSYDSGYTNDANCTWIIRAPPNQVVQLVFTKFHLEPQHNYYGVKDEEQCQYDVVYVYDESVINSNTSKYLGVFCGYYYNDRLPEVVSKTNTMYVQFISDSSRNSDGFVGEISFTYGESEGCGGTIRLNKTNKSNTYTLETPKFPIKTELDCGWLILSEPSYVNQIKIIRYTETPDCPSRSLPCGCSSIEFFDGPGRMAYKIIESRAKSCDELGFRADVVYYPIMSSGSEAYIRYRLYNSDINVNFEIEITPAISDCGVQDLMVTNETKILTSPKYPLPYETNLVCTWVLQPDPSRRIISLRFTDIDLVSTKDCTSDYIEIQYTKWASLPDIIIRLCHEDHEFDFIEQTEFPVTLKLRSDGEYTSKGFRLEYNNIKCKTKYEKFNGRITVSGYETGISTNENCTFTINLSQPNLTISVYFSSFIEIGKSNKNNYLKVYDGPTVFSPLVTSLTDIPTLPSPIFSTGPSLTISYKWDGQWYGALDISYTSTDQGRGCGGKLFNIEGTVTSPLYPYVYRKNTSCRWDIAVPRPYPISIAFRIFNMGKRTLCDTNYLELYNVDQVTGKSSFVAKYCGGDIPAFHTSESGAVFIRYVTTVHSDSSGWVLEFKLVHNLYNL